MTKKYLFFTLLGMTGIVLVGCNAKVPHQESLPWSYPPPQVLIQTRTWAILSDKDGPVTGQYAQDPISDFPYIFRYITGYTYTYGYPDLHVRIHVMRWIEPYVYSPPSTPIFQRSGDMIYAVRSHNIEEYVEVYHKTSSLSLYDELTQKYISSWCSLSQVSWENIDFLQNKDFIVWEVGDETRDNSCIADVQFPTNETFVFFVADPQNPSLYYKVSTNPDCAPWPCSIFGNIEFLK